MFNNDPNYETLVLYGPEGQIINVNSWIECANYVNGGWSSGLVETVNYEMYYFFALLSSTILYFLHNKLRATMILDKLKPSLLVVFYHYISFSKPNRKRN